MNRLSVILILVGALASLVAAASAPTFCKCTCFTNSTIIEIKPKSPTSKASGSHDSSSSSSHLKLPTEGDTAEQGDQGGPVLDDDDDDLAIDLFAPSTGVADRDHHATLRRRRGGAAAKRAQASPSCNQCNKAFCLSQSLPICKAAADKDVATMCFQRDSRKDQIIVWGFILGTAGLLGWAGVQKAVAVRAHGSLAGLPGGRRGAAAEGVRVGAAQVGATGSDAGRGAYVAVGGHSRDSSLQTGIGG